VFLAYASKHGRALIDRESALNVDDIAEATAFYTRMFGVTPHKQREGYANFAIEDPPLKLVLIENRGASERLNHLGIEASPRSR
jgi:catechol 2,3-dioxygenase-like lactoylglutathione lyase family enzyme